MTTETTTEQATTDNGFTEMRVAGTTNPHDLAGGMSSFIRQGKRVALVAIGAQAVAQAVKSVPIMNGFLASKALIFSVMPSMEDREIEENGTKVTRTVTILRLVRYDFR